MMRRREIRFIIITKGSTIFDRTKHMYSVRKWHIVCNCVFGPDILFTLVHYIQYVRVSRTHIRNNVNYTLCSWRQSKNAIATLNQKKNSRASPSIFPLFIRYGVSRAHRFGDTFNRINWWWWCCCAQSAQSIMFGITIDWFDECGSDE